MSRQSRQRPVGSKERSCNSADRCERDSVGHPIADLQLAGPDAQLTWQSERTGMENKWFALTGRVVAVKVEADGDLHLALRDATGDNPGIVVCEVPAKPQWCSICEMVFGWTRTRFPLHIQSTRKLTINGAPVVTVIGKAFWDIGHVPEDQSNRRKNLSSHISVNKMLSKILR
jgi:hypothetical protein